MIDVVIRFVKRFAVLIPGLAVAYFAADKLYPVLERRIPASIAVLSIYVLTAYILIPALIRGLRIIFKPKHLPMYCVTPDGFASDPINIGIVGTKQDVLRALKAAGWHQADPRTIKTLFQMIMAQIFRRPYLNAPFSNLYLFGRKQDFGFQLPVGNSPHHRHHVRFWACEPKLSETEQAHLTFWDQHQPKQKKRPTLWVGAASLDIGLGFIRHNAQITHFVHPDTDAERDLIVRDLKKSDQVSTSKKIKVGQPYKIRNRVPFAHLATDGKMTILTLKSSS